MCQSGAAPKSKIVNYDGYEKFTEFTEIPIDFSSILPYCCITRKEKNMDPNIALSRLRELLARWEEWGTLEIDAEAAMDEILDLFYGLDEWLSTGGFRPSDWS